MTEKIIAQQPAEGIMLTNEWGPSKMYKIACGCGQPDHEHTVNVEADETGVNVNIYTSVKTDYWTETIKKRYDIDNIWLQEFDWAVKGIINGVVTRLKLTWDIWTKGYIKYETTITMSEQQTINYAETLKSAVKDVKAFRRPKENIAAVKAANEQDCV